RGEAISAEIVPPSPARPLTTGLYHVQKGDQVQSYDEAKLVALIRRGKLTGMELARRDDEEEWQPLFESRLYRREVPTSGDPRDAARIRLLRAVGGHFSGFFITAVVMYAVQGHFPFWLAIWGAVLAMQALSAAPAALTLLRRRRASAASGAIAGGPGVPLSRQLGGAPGTEVAPSGVAQEAARVRALIEQRGGTDAARLLADVDGILKLTVELAARQADLEEQTSDRERASLARAVNEARARL